VIGLAVSIQATVKLAVEIDVHAPRFIVVALRFCHSASKQTTTRFAASVDCQRCVASEENMELVSGWPFNVIDDDDLASAFDRGEFQSELLLDRRG
jgi:hypothetical protein